MKKIILFLFFINSCTYPEMVRDEVIFEDNFESSVSDKISGGVIEDYNSSKF